MNKPIRFQQLIRTSSQVRRGFRTYQRSQLLNETIEDKLGTYSVYSPTLYTDIANVPLEAYPVMFMYCLQGNKKIFCKSTYIGLDRHSFPPRAGNYIAHALVYEGNELFNPVEIYEKARWKTREEVEAEDGHTAVVNEFIDDMEVITDPSFLNTKYLKELFEFGVDVRKKMFCLAVDSIIRGKKVIIIDSKEMLLKWAMTLLQVFPLEFVFKNLTITSFANSSLLFDLCNVLCFETENAETAQRYSTKATIINFDSPVEHTASGYANAVLHAIESDGLPAFREMVYPKIASSLIPGADDFNKAALFYEKLAKVGVMSPEDFNAFIQDFKYDAVCVQAIFTEVKRSRDVYKCAAMWYALKDLKLITGYDLSHYKYIATLTFLPDTDGPWIGFEKEVANRLHWRSLNEINDFFAITNIEDPRRHALYVDVVMTYMGQTTDIEKIREALNGIYKRTRTPEQEQQLQKIEEYLSALDLIQKADKKIDAFIVFREAVGTLDEARIVHLSAVLPVIGWFDFFSDLQKNKETFEVLYQLPRIENKLPPKHVAGMILNQEYHSKSNEFCKLYNDMIGDDKDTFEKHAPVEIREVIIKNILVDSPEVMEQLFSKLEKADTTVVIDSFIAYCKEKGAYDKLWNLCQLIQAPESSKATHPHLVKRLPGYKPDELYKALDDDDVAIPSQHESLAIALQKAGKLKRHLPKHEMILTLAFFRSIGQYEDIEKIRPYLKKHPLTVEMLYALIKLPWPWFAWEKLFEQLDEETREKMPELLGQLLTLAKNKGWEYSESHWHVIVCEYYVFVIKSNYEGHLEKLKNNLNPSPAERIYIDMRLLSIISKRTELQDKFLAAGQPQGWLHRLGIK